MNELLWNSLLNLRYTLCQCTESIDYVALNSDATISVNQSIASTTIVVSISNKDPKITSNQSLFYLTDKVNIVCKEQGSLSKEERDFLNNYLPYCFLPLLAKQKGRTISIAHFAQTLDGKIATSTGASKWIGNKENLIHAHRMRALSCSILVGRKTVLEDKPSLTVRLVKGKHPRRVVISSSPCDMTSLLYEDENEVLVFGKTDQPEMKGLNYNKLASQNGHIDCNTILQAMYDKGIYVVYIEGGARTTSNFLQDNAVDILQLHIAPMLFGSGQSAIDLPEIDQIKNAVHFDKYQYQQVGDTVMFVGELKPEE